MSRKELRSDAAAEPKKIKKQGWLERQSGDGRTWKRCWFAVCPDCVEYFRGENLREIQGKIPIIDCTVSKEHSSDQGVGFYFCIRVPPGAGKRTDFLIRAANEADRQSWVEEIDKLAMITVFGPGKVSASNVVTACRINPHKRGVYTVVPYFFVRGVQFLEDQISQIGLYRENGSQSRIERVQTMVDHNVKVEFDDPHSTAGFLKGFVRKLPEPLLLYRNIPEFQEIFEKTTELTDAGLKRFRRVLTGLPMANYLLIAHWFNHLLRVAAHEQVNLMGIKQLSVCIGPTLIWSDPSAPTPDVTVVQDSQLQQQICMTLLTRYDILFGKNPMMFYASTGRPTFCKLVQEQDTFWPYALEAPLGSIVQTVATDKHGWSICVFDSKWGVCHSKSLEEVTDPRALRAGLVVQPAKWLLAHEQTQWLEHCPEAFQLYTTLMERIRALREATGRR
jgi:hypothetical protein